MGKKVLNILILLSMIVIIFFIKMNNVRAFECKWYTVNTYINSEGIPFKSSSYDLNSSQFFALIYKSNAAWNNFRIYNAYNENNLWDITWKSDRIDSISELGNYKANKLEKMSDCPDYIKINANGIIESATETEFKNYLIHQNDDEKNTSLKTSNSSLLIRQIPLYLTLNSANDIYFVKNNQVNYPTGNTSTSILSNDDLIGLKKCGFKGNQDLYEKSYVYEELLYKTMDKYWEKAAAKAYYTIYHDVDTSYFADNMGSFFETFFGNLNSVGAGIQLADDDYKIASETLISFKKYFDIVSRYVFEEDLEKYSRYYIYANRIEAQKVAEYMKITKLSDEYNNLSESKQVEWACVTGSGALVEYEDVSEDYSKYLNNENICIGLCYNENLTAAQACQNGSNDFKECNNAYISCSNTQCNNKCNNLPNDTAKNACNKSCLEECMKNKLGDQKYSEFLKKYNEKSQDIQQQLKDIEDRFKDSLGILNEKIALNIDFEPYKAKCEDVVILHTIYMIMVIAAPILTLLFGVIDFTKSVLASDEKKILEFRKKFPKRLLLLMLFILVPLIISFILNLVGGDTSLMNCVINGK